MDWEKIFFSRLIIAVPEIAWADEAIQFAIRHGYVTQKEWDELQYWKGQYRRAGRIGAKLSSKSFTQRLLVLAPEVISIQSVNLLRRMGLIDDTDGHRLRLFVRSLTATGAVPGMPPSNATILKRMQSLSGVLLSQEVIDLYRLVPVPFLKDEHGNSRELSVREANILRGALLGSARLNAARERFNEGDGLIDRLVLVAGELLDERFVRAAVLTGAMSQKNARMIIATIKLGNTAWRTSQRVWNANGFEQRALIASTGLLSQEMIRFLRAVGIIDARTARTLQVVGQIGRSLARTRLDAVQEIRRSYRVLPGESPIATFARVSRYSDQDILSLLDEAAKETQARIAKLAPEGKIGAKTRAAQERILLNGIYNEIRALWEGVGYLTIIGERNAAMAAVDSMDFLQRRVWGKAGPEADQIRRMLREQGRAGVDNLISREENLRPLSRRVYKNIEYSRGLIARRIQINLIRGVSAAEFAKDVASLIRPNVRGGISYAAMRLARTEINNAFHITSIRYTREMPWVNGYKWNLSATHAGRMPKGDVCNDYASEDRYDMGPGNYPKRAVPSKPHPQCLCFITIIVMPPDQFRANYRRGTFNSWLQARQKAGAYADVPDPLAGVAPRISLTGPEEQ